MTDTTNLLPLVQKFFENDLNAAAGVLESMSEEEAAGALKSLPIPLAVQVVKVLQVGYAAALLKDAEDQFLIEMTLHLDPQFLAKFPRIKFLLWFLKSARLAPSTGPSSVR